MRIIGWALTLVGVAAVVILGKVVASSVGSSWPWTVAIVAAGAVAFGGILWVGRRMDKSGRYR